MREHWVQLKGSFTPERVYADRCIEDREHNELRFVDSENKAIRVFVLSEVAAWKGPFGEQPDFLQ